MVVVVVIIVICLVVSSIVYLKKKHQLHEVGGERVRCYSLFKVVSPIVNQLSITDNPAYDEGNYVHIITLYSSYYDHYIVHRLEMRSRRVELESNPSYITVLPSRTCTADYENIII